MTLEQVLHWLADQAGKLAGKAETDAVHTAITDLLGDHTAAPAQEAAAPQAETPAAPVPDAAAEGPPDASVPSGTAPYPGPPSNPEG